MNLRQRLARLERLTATGRPPCQRCAVQIVRYDDDVRRGGASEPEPCATCGRMPDVVNIRYVTDWEARGRPGLVAVLRVGVDDL